MLIGDSHDNANWNEKDSTYTEREDKPIPREVYRIAERLSGKNGRMSFLYLLFDDEDAHSGHAHERDEIPTEWRIFVPPHQSIVHILLADYVVDM